MTDWDHEYRMAYFFDRIDYEDVNDCWLWTGNITKTGYGWMKVRGVDSYAHRWAYEGFVGPIPEGLHIDHLCHTNSLTCPGGNSCLHRRCVNTDHLEPVTNAENARRSQARIARLWAAQKAAV